MNAFASAVAASALVVSVGGCHPDFTPPTDPSGIWLYEYGAKSGWTACLRLASKLRAQCGGDHSCERGVSDALSFTCYAGAYRGGGGHSICTAPEAEMPSCKSWGEELASHCEGELRYYRQEVCGWGDTTLTGAGP